MCETRKQVSIKFLTTVKHTLRVLCYFYFLLFTIIYIHTYDELKIYVHKSNMFPCYNIILCSVMSVYDKCTRMWSAYYVTLLREKLVYFGGITQRHLVVTNDNGITSICTKSAPRILFSAQVIIIVKHNLPIGIKHIDRVFWCMCAVQ